MKNLLLALTLLVSSVAMAAEDFTIASNEAITSIPQTVGTHTIYTSSSLSNNNGFDSVEVVLRIDSLTPDGATEATDYHLALVIETEIAGVWTPAAYQFNGVESTDRGQMIVQLSPSQNLGPGVDNIVQVAGKTLARISANTGVLADDFRVKVYVQQFDVVYPLEEATISIWGRKYNAN